MTIQEFVADLIPGCERGFGNSAAIGFHDRRGNLEAGVIYHNWNPESGVIEMSAASSHRRWVTRERLRAIFAYPFDEVGCRLVVARTDEGNSIVRRIFARFGAVETAVPELRGPGRSEIIITLDAETWRASRFMRASNGQA